MFVAGDKNRAIDKYPLKLLKYTVWKMILCNQYYLVEGGTLLDGNTKLCSAVVCNYRDNSYYKYHYYYLSIPF